MEENFLSIVNVESVTAVIAFSILYCLFLGVTDFIKTMEKIGE